VNVKLVELPNGDYANTIARSFLFDACICPCNSLDEQQGRADRRIAAKAVKEIAYQLKTSSDWVIRFGDGTEESHQRFKQRWTTSGHSPVNCSPPMKWMRC